MLPLLLAAASAPVFAIPPDQVATKLDSVLVFAPIDSKTPSAPLAISYTLDGASRSVYFAAFSPAAVQQVIKDRIAVQSPELAKTIRFAPFSLAKFDALVQPNLAKDKSARVLYIPDPEQVASAEKLMVAQGAKPADAKKVSSSVPSIFCPQPAIKATPQSGPLKGQSFVPCSTDFATVQAMVDKGIAANPDLKKANARVVAIPLTNFASMLAKSTDKEVGDLRILPSPSSLKAIDQLRTKAQQGAQPAPQQPSPKAN
jgi:hypothetical protein